MSNELKVRNGLIVVGNISSSAIISGSQMSASGFFGTASNAVSSSYATFAQNTNATTLSTGSTYQITSSWATNTSATTLFTASTYQITASYVVNEKATFLFTGSTYPITSSVALVAIAGGTQLATGSTVPITSSWTINALTASFALGGGGTTLFTGSTYPITSSWSVNAATASSLVGLVLDNSSSVSLVTASNVVVIQRITGSFIAAFFDYAVTSGSNIRAGTVFGAWIPGTSNVSYSEYTTVDVGDTTQVSMSLFLTQSAIQLLSNAATSFSWSVKAIGRYI